MFIRDEIKDEDVSALAFGFFTLTFAALVVDAAPTRAPPFSALNAWVKDMEITSPIADAANCANSSSLLVKGKRGEASVHPIETAPGNRESDW